MYDGRAGIGGWVVLNQEDGTTHKKDEYFGRNNCLRVNIIYDKMCMKVGLCALLEEITIILYRKAI